jgi:hypothetical protein
MRDDEFPLILNFEFNDRPIFERRLFIPKNIETTSNINIKNNAISNQPQIVIRRNPSIISY